MNPKDELKKKSVTLAGTIRKWNAETVEARKSVRIQLREIVDLGLNKYKMRKTELRNLVEEIFRYHGISESWIRKLLPEGLKYTSRTRLSYLHKQEIEKERQRPLLQQQASGSQQESEIREYIHPDGRTVESVSYQSAEPEITPSPSEVRQGLETYAHNELSEANKRIERLIEDVRSLSKPFVAKAYFQAAEQDIPLVAHIDPVRKVIT
jgi:polyhydroxyalkanoate synthesis regulator phasin